MNQKQTSQNITTEIKHCFPETPERFNQVLKNTLTEQMQQSQKCLPQPLKPHSSPTFIFRRKWVVILIAVLLFGTSVYAANRAGLFSYLSKLMTSEDVAEYMQEEINQTTEEETTTYSGPLWKITEAWYDGSTLYFYAETTEEGQQYDLGTDHITINGQDFLMNYYEEYDETQTHSTGRYICNVDMNESGISGRLNITIPLKVWKNNNPGDDKRGLSTEEMETYFENIQQLETQIIKFSVEENHMVKTVSEEIIPLTNGNVEITSANIALSKMSIVFTYRLWGSDAEMQIKNLNGLFTITDSLGNSIDTMYGLSGFTSISDVYVDADGNYCRDIEIETSGVNVDTDTLTFTPYLTEKDSEGKVIPDTGKNLEYGVFSIPLIDQYDI